MGRHLRLVRLGVYMIICLCGTAAISDGGGSFEPLTEQDDEFTIAGVRVFSSVALTPSVKLAVGNDKVSAPSLFAIHLPERRIMYASDEVSGGNGFSLYQYRTADHIVVLWEISTEYCSLLDCFHLDIRKDSFSYVGSFDISLPNYGDIERDCSYPVDQIVIEPTDSMMTFRFPWTIMLGPFENRHMQVDSAVYELRYSSNTLMLRNPGK